MVKQKKKRNKHYQGSGAAQKQPVITHVAAVKRNRAQLWWSEKKPLAKPLAIVAGIGAAIIVLLVGLLNLIF